MSSQQQDPQLTNDSRTGSATVIPQDKTGSAHAIIFGFSFPEIAFVVGPPLVLFLIAVRLLHLPPTKYLLGGLAALAFTLGSIVKLTKWYLTPVEFVARGFSHLIERTRMPLVGESARDVPGVVDLHPDADAAEECDGTLVAYVQAYLTNTSLVDEDGLYEEIARLTTGFNSDIGRAEGGGIDIKMRITQNPGSAGRHVEGLNEAATNPNLTGIAQRYAAEQSAHVSTELQERGVMDRVITIAVPVAPDDVNVSGGYLDKLAGSSFVRPSNDQYAAQKTLLDSRVNTVQRAIDQVTRTRRLDVDEVVTIYRQYWLDYHEPLTYTNLTTGTSPQSDPKLQALMSGVGTSEVDPSPQRTDGGTKTVSSDETDQQAAANTTNSPDQPEVATLARTPAETSDDGEKDGARSMLQSVVGSVRDVQEAASESSREKTIYSPAFLNTYIKNVELNDQYTSTLWVTGWPLQPQVEMLSSILAVPGIRYDMSLYFHSRDYREKLEEIENERQTTTSISLEDIGGIDDGNDAEALAADKGQLRDAMRDGDLECFEVSVAITVRGDSKEELQWARREIISRCSSRDISVDACHSRQRAGLVSTSPSSKDAFEDAVHVDTRFDLTSDVVAHLYPFAGYYRADPDGCTYGLVRTIDSNQDPLGVLQVDRRSLGVSHCCWIGRSGSGKTFDAQSHLFEELLRYSDRRAVVMDVKNGGFDGLVEAFGGTKVVVGETTINPFEVRPPSDTGGVTTPLEDQIRLLLDMFQIYLMHQGPDDDAEKVRSTNEAIIRKLYKDFGITADPATHDPDNRETARNPTMEDYFDVLSKAEDHPEEFTKRDSDLGREGLMEDLKILMNRLKGFDEDGGYGFLCGESEVDLYDRVVYFDMHKYRKDDTATKGMMLSLITAHAYRMIDQSLVNVMVDEAHDMFADAGRAGKIESMVRQGREAGLMFDFITQSDADFDEGAAAIIANQSPIKVWRDLGSGKRVSPTNFGLSPSQAQLVGGGLVSGDNDAADYSEAVVDIDGDRYFIEKRVSEYAQRVIEYKEAKHGDFDDYMAEAGFDPKNPRAAGSSFSGQTEQSTGPGNNSNIDRKQVVEDLLSGESSVYGGTSTGDTARVGTTNRRSSDGRHDEEDGRSSPENNRAPSANEPTASTSESDVRHQSSDEAVESKTTEADSTGKQEQDVVSEPPDPSSDSQSGDSVTIEPDQSEETDPEIEKDGINGAESESETQTDRVDTRDDGGAEKGSSNVDRFGRLKRIIGSPFALLRSSEEDPEPILGDIPQITEERAAVLIEAGFETPLDVWQADQHVLADLNEFDAVSADSIQRYAADIVDRDAIPSESSSEVGSPERGEHETEKQGKGDIEGIEKGGFEQTTDDLQSVRGIGDARATALSEIGIETADELASAEIAAIVEADGIGTTRAQQYKDDLTARSDGGAAAGSRSAGRAEDEREAEATHSEDER